MFYWNISTFTGGQREPDTIFISKTSTHLWSKRDMAFRLHGDFHPGVDLKVMQTGRIKDTKTER